MKTEEFDDWIKEQHDNIEKAQKELNHKICLDKAKEDLNKLLQRFE